MFLQLVCKSLKTISKSKSTLYIYEFLMFLYLPASFFQVEKNNSFKCPPPFSNVLTSTTKGSFIEHK